MGTLHSDITTTLEIDTTSLTEHDIFSNMTRGELNFPSIIYLESDYLKVLTNNIFDNVNEKLNKR